MMRSGRKRMKADEEEEVEEERSGLIIHLILARFIVLKKMVTDKRTIRLMDQQTDGPMD